MKKLVIIVLFLIALAIPAIAAVSYTPPCMITNGNAQIGKLLHLQLAQITE